MSLRCSQLRFSWFVWLFLGVLVFGLGCGGGEPEKSTKSPEQKSEPTQTGASNPKPQELAPNTPTTNEGQTATDPKAQLKADINDAIALLEKGDSATFIEQYMPVEFLELISEQSMTIDEMAERLNSQGNFQKTLLEMLRNMQNGEVVFLDKSKLMARLDTDPSSQDLAAPEFDVANPADEKIPVTEGFPGDIPEAIGGAIAALEAKEYQKFIENMFPASEMYLTTSDENMQALLLRLKEHPQMAEQMLTDLKALQKLTPEMDQQGLIATFQLNAGTKQARTVKFEKFVTWRFANTAKEVRTQVYEQAQQLLAASKAPKTKWIRIRDHWRLHTID